MQGQCVMEALPHTGSGEPSPEARPACAKALWQENPQAPRVCVREVSLRS